MKKALIIGISGQDGAYLAKFLLARNYEVYGTSRDAQVHSFSNLEILGIKGQVVLAAMAVNDFRNVFTVLRDIKPDEIYNLSGPSSVGMSFLQPVETMESIALGTFNILEALRLLDYKSRYYNACSSECFGNTDTGPADETTPFRPRSPYAVAKSAAYWAVDNYRQSYDIFACSGILFNHESPLRPERFVTQKIVAAGCRIYNGCSDKLLLGNIHVQRDWGWAPEYVEAVWSMLQQDSPEDYIIATGKSQTLEFFIDTVFSYLGLQWPQHVEIDKSLYRPDELTLSRANPAKAQSKLNWKATYACKDVVHMMVDSYLARTDGTGDSRKHPN